MTDPEVWRGKSPIAYQPHDNSALLGALVLGVILLFLCVTAVALTSGRRLDALEALHAEEEAE